MPRKLNTKVPSPDPLPRWLDLPLESKLPMLKAPKGALVLYTTKIAQKLRKTYPELDFDLNDPHSHGFNNSYKPLHDTYLRAFLASDEMRKRLYHGGFITRDGKVLCTLKEYNDYRAYLRSINLDLEKRRLTLEKERLQREMKRRRRHEAAAMLRKRDEHMKEVENRLSKQTQEDRIKSMSLSAERDNMTKEQRVMSDVEREATRNYNRKQEIRHKMSTLRRWLQDDLARTRRIEERRIDRDEERRQKLDDEWEKRKKMQAERLESEEKKRQAEEEDKNKRVQKRQEMIDKQREKQQDTLLQIIEQRRKNRAHKEADYQRRLRNKLANKRRRDRARDRRRREMVGADDDDEVITPKSYWNIEDSLEHLIIVGQRRSELEKDDGGRSASKSPKRGSSGDRERAYSGKKNAAITEDVEEGAECEVHFEGKESLLSDLDDCRCSLMKLHKVAVDMADFDSEAKSLAVSLQDIMADLKLGKLKPYQVQTLTEFAKDILEPRLSPEALTELETLTSPAPGMLASDLAKTIVSEVVDSVQDTLLPIHEGPKKSSDLTALTKSLAQQAIASTTQKLLNETGGFTDTPASLPPDEDSVLRQSYTSDLVRMVLRRSGKRIVRDMRGSVNSTAELKAYIDDIIQQCMQELVQEYLDEKVPKPDNQQKPNYVSVASMLVRDTITDVIKELCEESKIPSPFGGILPNTASSVFVESVILETMKECLQDLREKKIPTEKLVAYSADILATHSAIKKKDAKDDIKNMDKLAVECGYQRASSTLLDGLIFHIVTGTLYQIEHNELSKAQIKRLEASAKHSKSGEGAGKVKKALQAVLDEIGGKKPNIAALLHWDAKVPLQDIVFSNQAKSLESLHAETAVLQALYDGQQKVYAPQEETCQDMNLLPERKISAAAERCVSMAMGRAVHEYFTAHQDQPEESEAVPNQKDRNEDVDDLVDYSIGLVIMQLANESQGGEEDDPDAAEVADGSDGKTPSPNTQKAGNASRKSTTLAKSNKKGKGKLAGKKAKAPSPPPTKAAKTKAQKKAAPEPTPPPRPKTPPPQNKPKSRPERKAKATVKDDKADESDEDETPQDSKLMTPYDSKKSFSSAYSSRTRGSIDSNPHCGHTVVESSEFVHSDESDECSLEPMVDQDTLSSIDRHVVDNNLSVLSVKRIHDLHHFQPNQAVARNSFRNLVNPNMHKVRRFSEENQEEIAKHFVELIEEHDNAQHSVKTCNSDDSSDDAPDDAPKPGEKEDVFSVTEIHTAEELHKIKAMSRSNADLAQTSSKSVRSRRSSKSSAYSSDASEKSSNTSVSSKSSSGSEKSGQSEKGSRPVLEEYQGSKIISASIPSVLGPSQTAVPKSKSDNASTVSVDRRADIPTSDTDTAIRARETSAASEKSDPISEDDYQSATKSTGSGDENETSEAKSIQDTSVSDSKPTPNADTSEAKSVTEMPTGSAKSVTEAAYSSDTAKSVTEAPSDDDQIEEVIEKKAPVKKLSKSNSSRSSLSKSGSGDVTMEAMPSRKSSASSVNSTASVKRRSSGSSHQMLDQTPRPSSSHKKKSSSSSIRSKRPQGSDASSGQATPKSVKSQQSEEAPGAPLTPKESLESLAPTDAVSTTEPMKNENESSRSSIGLTPKSSVSSLDAMSRARLSHAHKDAPKQTTSDIVAEDKIHVEKPHSPVGSLPDLQTSDTALDTQSENKEEKDD